VRCSGIEREARCLRQTVALQAELPVKRSGSMPGGASKLPDDPFDGLRLPLSAWKALESARITSLDQLEALAPLIEQVPGIEPRMADVIKDRLERLASRRVVRVRFIFPKRSRARG
jgi:hypothetical protein